MNALLLLQEMTYKYYESRNEGETSFDFGDVKIEMKEKKERFSGIFIRKLLASKKAQEPKLITHIQETCWEDNRAPDLLNSDNSE